jgi:uncharacterized protein
MTHSQPIPVKFAIAALALLAVWTVLLLALPYSATLSLVLKVALFGISSFALLRFAEPECHLSVSLGLGRAPNLGWIVVSSVLLVAYLVVSGGWAGLRSVSPFFIASAVIISPLVEEFAFREVLLQQLSRFWPFGASNVATTLLFVLYHIPLWLARGQTVEWMACLWVAAFSLWVGYVMRRSKSLWTCIIVHAIQNLLLRVSLI